jgi:hypothetical protein
MATDLYGCRDFFMNQTNTEVNNGRANFDVITVDVKCDVASDPFTATIELSHAQFEGSRYRPKIPRENMPVFTLGSLVALLAFGECVHVGVVTEVFEDGSVPKFMIDIWPLAERVTLRKREINQCEQRSFGRAAGYALEGRVDNQHFRGTVMKLRQIDADHLRAQIGPVVPSKIREIFWSEAEHHLIQVNLAAQQRYFDQVATLIERL